MPKCGTQAAMIQLLRRVSNLRVKFKPSWHVETCSSFISMLHHRYATVPHLNCNLTAALKGANILLSSFRKV